MPVQLYETLFLIDSTKLAGEPDVVRGTLHASIEKVGGKIEVTRPWDDRKLTYPIQKQKKGSYHIIYYRLESRQQSELEREFKLNENLLRWMTIHIPAKWEGAMLDVAHNDHGAAFALRGIQDEPSPTDGTPTLNLGEGGLPMGEAVAAATGGRRPRPPRDLAEKPE